ncbi:hypothetical protein L0P88_03945 [Muricauda sp. SCSIO 64092]|uniref:hypothetical protein n=1 Tax=Allomuricauda sp. SCSIO 64092 TaxID=2908842 RepID=UPI001FF4F7A4|nr:hypothetical protein [Muricauda sp. SCSIO 64092]UOY07706.1 hypothetical protein L0P88_03945 [Muricauda sp. SCSIO 64092]
MKQEKLSQEKRTQIINAILEMNQMACMEMMLGDVRNLYLMALPHHLMNDQEIREAQTLTFLHLHDCLAKLDMIINDRDGCWQLAS